MALGKEDQALVDKVVKSGGSVDTRGMADQRAKEIQAELNRQREAAAKKK